MVQNDDKYLLERICGHSDRNAYDMLYLRYFAILVGYGEIFVSHPEAEDIVQKVLLGLWEKRRFLQISGTLSSYLFISVRNACLDCLRHDDVRHRAMSDLRLSIIDSAADWNSYHFNELLTLLRQCLSELPEEQRRAFEMNRFEGKTYREIALETGVSQKTVEYRISQALRKLEKDLTDYLPLMVGVLPFLYRYLR